MEEARRENRWVICVREPQRKKKKGRKVGIFGDGKPNGRGEEREPLGGMCEGDPTEEEKGKKSWDIWGWKTQRKRGNERKIGERHII